MSAPDGVPGAETPGAGTAGAGSAGTGPAAPGSEPERPGDPVCLLRRVCPACGSVANDDPPTTCPECHTELPG